MPDRSKPPLFLVAHGIHPHQGSEPGKGFTWARALGDYFQLHIFTTPEGAEACRSSPHAAEWIFHPVPFPLNGRGALRFYYAYFQWTRALLPELRRLKEAIAPVALHHVTMGSFRILPRYDRLGLPYVLGPLGGGEFAPPSVLRQTLYPFADKWAELLRPWINRRMAGNNRAILSKARLVIGTTPESEALLRGAGARRTTNFFPDIFESPLSPAEIEADRAAQLGTLQPIRLIWAARFLWWKGGQIVVDFLKALKKAGVPARLAVYSQGAGYEKFRDHIRRQGVEELVDHHGFVPREKLLAAFRQSHLFVFPTLHDSASAIIPEAYALGLPSMTLGIGGMALCVSPEAGLNHYHDDLPRWIGEGVAMAVRWQADPQFWLTASRAALKKSRDFSIDILREKIERQVVPFLGKDDS